MRLCEAVEALVVCYPPCVKGGCPENIQHMERLHVIYVRMVLTLFSSLLVWVALRLLDNILCNWMRPRNKVVQLNYLHKSGGMKSIFILPTGISEGG